VAVGIGGIGVGGGLAVPFGIAARVAATICLICASGSGLGAQEVTINTSRNNS